MQKTVFEEIDRERQEQPIIFSYKISDTLAQNEHAVLIPASESTTPNARKYLPFDSLTIENNSDEDLEAYINSSRPRGSLLMFVPSKTQRTFDKAKVRMVAIKNVSATTTSANEIYVQFVKDVAGSDKLGNILVRSNLLKGLEALGLISTKRRI